MTETAAVERLCKTSESGGPHRLGSIEGYPPTRQVQQALLFFSDPVGAQVVGEIWASAGYAAIFRDGLQPTYWLLQKAVGDKSTLWAPR